MRTYDEYQQLTEAALIPCLSSLGDIPSPLWEAMSYSLQGGGKRIRPVLLLAACEMAGGDAESALPSNTTTEKRLCVFERRNINVSDNKIGDRKF